MKVSESKDMAMLRPAVSFHGGIEERNKGLGR